MKSVDVTTSVSNRATNAGNDYTRSVETMKPEVAFRAQRLKGEAERTVAVYRVGSNMH
jgi:hypothetical protein